jgi:hypothetical protein
MKREIQRLSTGLPRAPFEREIRDTEIEARTLARVVLAAERLVASLDPDDPAADGVRALVTEFYSRADLPTNLRAAASLQSRTCLTNDAPSEANIDRGRRRA